MFRLFHSRNPLAVPGLVFHVLSWRAGGRYLCGMAFSAQGFIDKHDRLKRADGKVTQPEGEYESTMFFSKGERRGVLACYEGRMVWDCYRDPIFTQHVDWNDPDSRCLNALPSPTTKLHVLSTLFEAGWTFDKEVFE